MDFLGYAKSLNPSVLSFPLTGSLNTYDGYNRTVTVSGSPSWIKTSKGFGFHPRANGLYSIDHGAEQLFTDQTIFIFSEKGFYHPSTVGFNGDVVDKRSALLGRSYTIRLITGAGPTKYIYVYNNAGASQSVTKDVTGLKSLAVSMIGSSAIKLYYNGVFATSTAGLNFSTQPTSPINIGNVYAGSLPIQNPIDGVVIVTSALTEEQISNLHSEFDKMKLVSHPRSHPYRKTLKNSPKVSISGPPNVNKIIPDKSGNLRSATVSGNMTISNDGQDTLYNFPGSGAGVISITQNSDINNMAQSTYVLDLNKIRSGGEASAGRLISKNRYYGYYIPGPLEIRWYQIYSGGNAQWSITPVPLNQGGRLVISHDRSSPGNAPTAQLNGVDLNVAVFAATTGTPSDDSTYDFLLGNYSPSTTRQADMICSGLDIYNKLLSTDEKRQEYLDHALNHVIRYTDRFEHPVTFSNVSAPSKVGPWNTLAGAHSWVDDGSDRYLSFDNTANNFASLVSLQAYGAWYAKIKNDGNSGVDMFPFIASKNNIVYTGAGQTGYTYYRQNVNGDIAIFRMNGGTATYLGGLAAWGTNNEFYEVFITRRRTDGLIKVYLRDQTHSTFTFAFQVTDNTYTTSNFIQAYHANTAQTMKVYNVSKWEFGDSLLPTDVPELRNP